MVSWAQVPLIMGISPITTIKKAISNVAFFLTEALSYSEAMLGVCHIYLVISVCVYKLVHAQYICIIL